MMGETLFGYYYDNLIDATQNWFDRANSQVLTVEDNANFSAISSDRRSNLISNSVLTIYNEDKNGSETNYIPAVRLSELYYIMAEAQANTNALSDAITLFNTFLRARGVTSSTYQIPSDADIDAFYDYLYDDIRKEYAGLGQNIFVFKRLNVPIRYSGGDMTTVVGQLVMPVPEGMDKEAMLDAIIQAEIRRPELMLYKAQELEIDTQLDYWTAGGLPQFSLFIRGGYGRPGLNMMDNSFQPFAIGGIRLVWNISQLYSLGYGKKIVNYSKEQINTVRETFLFNTDLQVQEQVAEIRRYFRTVEDDEKIVELREGIRRSTEAGVENGTKNASDLVSEINKENAARKQLIMHQIEMMKAIYELKTIKNS